MEKIKLMIADADTKFVNRVLESLEANADIEIIGTVTDGASGLQMVKKLQPDVVLFDLVLPGLDGITFLRSISVLRNAPMAICCSQFYSTVGIEGARKYGAAYFLFKPIEYRILSDVIKGCLATHRELCCSSIREEEPVCSSLEIRNYLVALGIPSKLLGCSYLTEAVRLARSDISLTQNLSKGLYLEISRCMNTTPSCIERSIRNAISAAYQNGHLGEQMRTCPSNKEFINFVLSNFNR